MHTSEPEERKVEGVEPNDRLIALVAVVVPVPSGGDDDITPLQGNLLTLYGGETLAVDDEPDGKGNMAVSRGSFARVDELETTIYGIRRIGRF